MGFSDMKTDYQAALVEASGTLAPMVNPNSTRLL